ncbi:MAG TPA: protease pro-enzyme activation domain-containing protein, partial [Candidatus Binataceae bacterium]|nr:protease pro-enzyme activation domain-containing protein [Candidatus Binataceae bacterium]
MISKRSARVLLGITALLAAIGGYVRIASAGPAGQSPMITQAIDDTRLVTLAGNVRPQTIGTNDAGLVANDLPMDHILLQLRRSPQMEQAFVKYLDELQEPGSPNYHHWLTASQIGANYGPESSDQAKIVAWLKSHGFTVNRVLPNGLVIDFSGTAGQVAAAFHTAIHRLRIRGKLHIANLSDPQIPAALAPAIVGVVSLNDFRPHPLYSAQPNYTQPCSDSVSIYNAFATTCYSVAPADLATIYNLNPLFNAGITGQGQTIAVVEESDMYDTNDWENFRQTFGLDTYTGASLTPSNPGGCTDPGVIQGDELEATIDTEWATAAAPSAAIIVAACENTNATSGELLALQGIINTSTPPPQVVSISYGEAESMLGAALNASISSLFQTAVGEGISVFVA